MSSCSWLMRIWTRSSQNTSWAAAKRSRCSGCRQAQANQCCCPARSSTASSPTKSMTIYCLCSPCGASLSRTTPTSQPKCHGPSQSTSQPCQAPQMTTARQPKPSNSSTQTLITRHGLRLAKRCTRPLALKAINSGPTGAAKAASTSQSRTSTRIGSLSTKARAYPSARCSITQNLAGTQRRAAPKSENRQSRISPPTFKRSRLKSPVTSQHPQTSQPRTGKNSPST